MEQINNQCKENTTKGKEDSWHRQLIKRITLNNQAIKVKEILGTDSNQGKENFWNRQAIKVKRILGIDKQSR